MHDISDDLRLVVLVHNLGYEVPILKRYIPLSRMTEVLMDSRKVLRVVHDSEYRCTLYTF